MPDPNRFLNIISQYECLAPLPARIHMPRGILENIREVARNAGSELVIIDHRSACGNLSLQFRGSLTASKERTVRNLLTHEMGDLVAPPGAGGTVMGCFADREAKCSDTDSGSSQADLRAVAIAIDGAFGLILTANWSDRRWKKTPNWNCRLGNDSESEKSCSPRNFFYELGFIVVDECHHLPAFTFEGCFRRAPVRYVLGLTATPSAVKVLQSIITMRCDQ